MDSNWEAYDISRRKSLQIEYLLRSLVRMRGGLPPGHIFKGAEHTGLRQTGWAQKAVCIVI